MASKNLVINVWPSSTRREVLTSQETLIMTIWSLQDHFKLVNLHQLVGAVIIKLFKHVYHQDNEIYDGVGFPLLLLHSF